MAQTVSAHAGTPWRDSLIVTISDEIQRDRA
jgi:hypothetical protein